MARTKETVKPLAEWRGTTARKPWHKPHRVEECHRRIGEICLEMRERRGMTQEDVARATGWSRASVANIEAGRQRVQLHDLPSLAKALGIPARDLLPPEWL